MNSIARGIREMESLMPVMAASACQQKVPPLTGQAEPASDKHEVCPSILAEAVENGLQQRRKHQSPEEEFVGHIRSLQANTSHLVEPGSF